MDAPKSAFGFSNIIITKSFIEQDIATEQGKEVNIGIIPTAKLFKGENKFQLQLDVKVNDVNNRFSVDIVAVGFFPTENILQDNNLYNFLCVNAPALMFPYIRAFITTITAQSGLETVILPPTNLTGLGQVVKDSIEVIE